MRRLAGQGLRPGTPGALGPGAVLARTVLLGVLLGALAIGWVPPAAGEGEAEAEAQTQTQTPQTAETPRAVFPLADGLLAVTVELARTEAERTRGLGGHAPLGGTEGMLFVFERAAPHAFWMKGMTFPLDIIWIDEGRVVHLERDLPPSGPEETDATRPIYTPPLPARYVLEVNAGSAAAHGIEVGTAVELSGI